MIHEAEYAPRRIRAPFAPPAMSNLLAVVTTAAPWSPAAHMAAQLAARWGSALTGCLLDPGWRDLDASHASAFSTDGMRLERDAAGTPPDGHAFGAFARDYGVQETHWARPRAGIAQCLRMLGAWHDLVILERNIVSPEHAAERLGEALLGCRIPCLLLPPREPDYMRVLTIQRVAVGWNGSLESIRALHSARPLLLSADEVFILDGSVDAGRPEDGLPRFDPVQALSRLGIAAHRSRLRADLSTAGATLLEDARHADADLLVMGAYGRSMMRERQLGGATRHILMHADLPVLMQH